MEDCSVIKQLLVQWLSNGEKSEEFKKFALKESISRQKKGKGFISVMIRNIPEYSKFIRDPTRYPIFYGQYDNDKIPKDFKERYDTVDMKKEFLLFVKIGRGENENDHITYMDVLSP